MSFKMSNRTTFAELAGAFRVALGIGDGLGAKTLGAILATAPFWIMGGAFFSFGFFAKDPAATLPIVIVSAMMWVPCSIATICGFYNIFKGDQ